jgi:cobyrinic acid a,c-diamide synthase
MKGFIISAPMTGSGKTTVTLGLLAALRQRGIAVQPFKVGPDFIDPGLHEIAAGVPSHNLDGWMLTREANASLFSHATANAELAVVEGVMGLFDGFDGKSERGSTAEMAKWLDLPVILVIDAHAIARSAAAMVHGFRDFDPEVKIAGVIFNRVAGEGHYRILADALADVPILGWLPYEPSVELPERHLGLFTAKEEETINRIATIGDFIGAHIEVDNLPGDTLSLCVSVLKTLNTETQRHRVALAHDKAFSFYYHANRMALEAAGAEIVEFSPLTDSEVPNAELLYIGGGYPEIYRRELEANTSMRASVKRFIDSGKKFYAECGGLMYLAESIDEARMVGILPVKITMTDHLVDFGYCEITTQADSIFGKAGISARGHQFHYSRALGNANAAAYSVRQGKREYSEGFIFPNGIASYIHLHFLSNPAIAQNMLQS